MEKRLLFHHKINGNTDVEDLFEMLEKNPDMASQRNVNGHFPVYIASEHYMYEFLSIELMDKYPDLVMVKYSGDSIMHRAVKNGNFFLSKKLLEYNHIYFLNIKNQHGDTPLHVACFWRRFDIIELILNYTTAVAVNDRNWNGYAPLLNLCLMSHHCPFNDLRALDRLLLHPNIEINIICKQGLSPLHVACNDNNYVLKRLLDDTNINVNCIDNNGNTPLHLAAKRNNVMSIKMLLSHPKIDINIKNNSQITPLFLAVRGNKDDDSIIYTYLVQILLDAGADIQKEFNHPFSILHEACMKDNDKIVEILITNNRISINDYNITYGHLGTALHIACHFEAFNTVGMLLNLPSINIETVDKHNNTPLMVATKINTNRLLNDQTAILKMLLEKGANVNSINEFGDTPLHRACYEGNIYFVNQLLNHPNINLNKVNNKGETALMKACNNNPNNMDGEIVSLLLNDCRTNCYYDNHRLPIYYSAIVCGNASALKFFMNSNFFNCQNIDWEANSFDGNTIFHYAVKECYTTVRLQATVSDDIDTNVEVSNNNIVVDDDESIAILCLVLNWMPNRNLLQIKDNNNLSVYNLVTNKRKRKSKHHESEVKSLLHDYMWRTRIAIYELIWKMNG
jgi:ankyrin